MTTPIYTVYKITNTINNKIYIGVHKTTKPDDYYMGSGLIIKRAINKHGKENFTKEILFKYDNSDDAYLKESQIVDDKFIKQHNTYNLTTGGYGISLNTKLPESTKLAMRKNRRIQTGKLNHQFKGYYITPWGKFESRKQINCDFVSNVTISSWCKNPNKTITLMCIVRSNYFTKDDIGKTYHDLGFDFITL